MTSKLFCPLDAGDLKLKNRIIMGPLTRNRFQLHIALWIPFNSYDLSPDQSMVFQMK